MSDPILIDDAEMAGLTKYVYETYRLKLFGIQTPLLSQIKKGKAGGPKNMRWQGKGVQWDIVIDPATGFTASQLGHLPPSSNEREVNPLMGIKRTYITRDVDHLTVYGTNSKEGAFMSIKRKITEALIEAGQIGQQEVIHGDGTAVKALVTAATDTTHVDVSSPYGVSGAGQGGLLLFVGGTVAVLDASAANAVLGRSVITSVVNSGDTATVTFATAISGMAVGDKIVSCSESDTSFNNFPQGALAILNYDGSTYNDYLNVNAATYPRWDAVRLTAGTDTPSAANVDEMDVFEVARKISGRSGFNARNTPGEFILITTPGIYKNAAQSFLGQRTYTKNDMMDIKGGFKALEVFGMPMLEDEWMPAGKVYLLHVPSLTWVDQKDFAPVSHEGGQGWRWIDGRDASSIHHKMYWNLGALVRGAHGMITGITDTRRYSWVV